MNVNNNIMCDNPYGWCIDSVNEMEDSRDVTSNKNNFLCVGHESNIDSSSNIINNKCNNLNKMSSQDEGQFKE